MARRREISNEKLTEAELGALRQRLSAMPLQELETFYKAVHNACRYTEVRAPAPAGIRWFQWFPILILRPQAPIAVASSRTRRNRRLKGSRYTEGDLWSQAVCWMWERSLLN